MSNKSLKFFTSDELARFWNVIENDMSRYRVRNEAIMRVAYECALRVSEVNHLQLQDYNSREHSIYCNRLKHGESNTLCLLEPKTIESLELHLIQRKATSQKDFIFLSQKGNFISRKTLDNLMKYYCQLAKIEDVSKHHFHTLRHTRAIELAEVGADLKELQFYLGHKRLENTMIYYKFTTTQYLSLQKKIKKSSYGKM